MAHQLSLAGIAPAAAWRDALFFAIYPDPADARRVSRLASALADELQLRGRRLPPHRLHLTLHPFGEFAGLPLPLVEQARSAGATLSERAFDIVFDRVESFERRPGREMPLVLLGDRGTDALLSFHARLGAALADVGLQDFAQRPYTPHMTLLYDRVGLRARAVAPIVWRARGFKLIHSLRGRSEHRVLDGWSFR
jgi:2'-5' RNA ligase